MGWDWGGGGIDTDLWILQTFVDALRGIILLGVPIAVCWRFLLLVLWH